MDIEDGNFTMKHKADLKITRNPSTGQWGGEYSVAVTATKGRGKGRRMFSPQ